MFKFLKWKTDLELLPEPQIKLSSEEKPQKVDFIVRWKDDISFKFVAWEYGVDDFSEEEVVKKVIDYFLENERMPSKKYMKNGVEVIKLSQPVYYNINVDMSVGERIK